MTPNLGQGACQAIEDALELAACLANETDLDLGLQKYEKRRIARTGPIVLASRHLGRIAQVEDPTLCRLRDSVLQLTPSSVTYRGLAGVIGYEGHPFSLRARVDGPKAVMRPGWIQTKIDSTTRRFCRCYQDG